MTVSRRILFGTAASWFSRGVSLISGLVIIPVLFRHLAKEELGVWLLLGQTWSVLGVLDFGFSFTLTRRIALAVGQSPLAADGQLTPASLSAIADLIAVARRAYKFLGLVSFVLSSGIGALYLHSLHLTSVSLSCLAWMILCLSYSIGAWTAVWTCLLQGAGYVGIDALVSSIAGLATLLLQIIAVLSGGGLIALATIAAAGALVQRYSILWFARRKRPELFRLNGAWNRALLRAMVPPSFRAFLTSIGGVIVLNTDQLFIAKLDGADAVPAYRAAYLVFLNLAMLSVAIAGAASVFVSHLWEAGQYHRVRRLVQRNLRFGLSLILCGGAAALILGRRLFGLWLGPGHFVGYPILLTFFALLTLETHAFIISTSSRATEDEAFAPCALIAAILKVAFVFIMGSALGLLGIALSTLFAQLLTNHWFMMYRGLQRLGISLSDHAKRVLAPMGILLLTVSGTLLLLQQLSSALPDWLMVGCGLLAAAFVFAAGLWLLVFDDSDRSRIWNVSTSIIGRPRPRVTAD